MSFSLTQTVQAPSSSPPVTSKRSSVRRPAALLGGAVLPLLVACGPSAPPDPGIAPCAGHETMEAVLLPLAREAEPGVFGPRYLDPEATRRLLERELTSRRVMQTGIATVRVELSATGEVVARELVSNTGGSQLGQAAEAIARQLRYRPAERAGCAIPALVDFELRLGRG